MAVRAIACVERRGKQAQWLDERRRVVQQPVERGQRLIPVVLADAELPPMLASRLWVDLRGKSGAEYLAAVESIARSLRGERPGPPL